MNRRWLALCALVAALSGAGRWAHAQEPTPDPAVDARELQPLVDAILGKDWRAAEQAARALEQRGLPGARVALAARAKTRRAPERDRLDRVVRSVVSALVLDLQRPLVTPPTRSLAVAALGDLGACADPATAPVSTSTRIDAAAIEQAGATGRDEPHTSAESQRRAAAAHAALVALGPAAIGIALEVPPVRSPLVERALYGALARIYELEAARCLASKPAQFRAAYKGTADLASIVVLNGLRDPREAVRAQFQLVRDEAVASALAGLDAEDPPLRDGSWDELGRLSDLARPALERIAKGQDKRSPAAQLAAERLARRIRFHLSPALIRKIGHELEGYSDLPFDRRRSLAFELERLGGVDAVPALRALLVEEPSEEVRAVAAIGLYKQGDWVGAEWLRTHGQKVNRISKRDLAALILDQGNKYLVAKKYDQAEKQYLQVLDLEPKNNEALYNLACCYSLWGRTDDAIVLLKRSIDAGYDDVAHMEKDSDLDPLREDPRFKAIIDALKAKKAEAEGQKTNPDGRPPEPEDK